MAGIADLLDSDGSKALLLLAVVATVLFTDIVRSFLGEYTLQTKVVLLGALLVLLWIFYSDVGDERGMTTPYDLFVRPFTGAYRAAQKVYEVLRRGWESERPDTDGCEDGERAQIGTLLDIILIVLEPIIRWGVDNWEFLVMLAIVLWALDASGYYPAVQILGDFVTGIIDWGISLAQDIVNGVIDWLVQAFKDSI